MLPVPKKPLRQHESSRCRAGEGKGKDWQGKDADDKRVLPDQVRKRMVMQKHAAAGRPEVQTRQLWYTMQYQALGWLGGTVPSNFR